jgi:ankyrin repeat protein
LEILLGDPRIDVHITDGQGHTALHLAVIYDDHLAVQILLQSRSLDVDRSNFAGDSALLLAAKMYGGFEPRRDAILKLLVSYLQSMVSQCDTKGCSLLQYTMFTSNWMLIVQLV